MQVAANLRPARVDDAEAIRAIYRPFVESTAISFETEVPSIDDMADRVRRVLDRWCWLVAETDTGIVGYAYGSAHRPRAAYRYSVETSAYVDARFRRIGVARALYEALFEQLEARGYQSAFAGITLPNDASVGFHRSLGFAAIGTFPRVGWKLGSWHDVAWMYRPLQHPSDC